MLGRDRSYFVKKKQKKTLWFYQWVLWNWYHPQLEFLINNICVIFGWRVFQQSVYLWVQTVLLFSPTCSFPRTRQTSYRVFLRKNQNQLARSFSFAFRYIDDDLLLNNSRFGDFVDRIYPIELDIKYTTDTDRSASYLGLHLEVDSEGWIRTKLYDKIYYFNFPIVNFPFIRSNIPAEPAYGVYISLSWYDIPELVVPIRISLIEGCC